MNRFSPIIAITIGLCLLSSVSWASKVYVTDNFRISLRRGPSIENKILKFLPSGQPVEVLEAQEGWSRVRPMEPDQDSIEGWVLSRYLMSRLPWANQTRSLKEINTRLSTDLALVEKKYKETALREQALSKEIKKYTDDLDKSRTEYKYLKRDSSKYLNLKSAYDILQGDVKKLKEENEVLKKSQRNKWFAMGALVLLCGLIIGLLFGRQEKKRRSYY
ncbi:TIGR04211 family SH3 domain-containing protein [Thermodesulfobacteriota bacterium]